MFEFEEKVSGIGRVERVWELYSDVNKWRLWDKSLEAVVLSGKFIKDSTGIMTMKNGMKMPFTIIECTPNKSFCTKSELGNLCIKFDHTLEQREGQVNISHRVTIEGGEKKQMEGIGNQIIAGLSECLKALIAQSNQ